MVARAEPASANPAPASRPSDVPVAMVNGQPVDRERLVKPLIEAYGLNVLLQVIQLELARQDAAKAGFTASPADFEAERAAMMKGFFPDAEPGDYPQMLEQLLKQQSVTRPQFEIVVQTNAYLRKMAQPLIEGKISEANIRQAFEMMYGATVKIRDVQVSNMAEALEVKQRAAKDDFSKLAKMYSKDVRTRELGGEWPPFSRNSTGVSDAIKDQAFSLKEGEISDPISTEGSFHIIKVEKHIAPRVAKYEDQRENLLKLLNEKLLQETIKSLRIQLAQEATAPNVLDIRDPVLAKQFQDKLTEHKAQAAQQLEDNTAAQNRRRIGLPPASAPATQSATQPAGSEARERPPATKSGR